MTILFQNGYTLVLKPNEMKRVEERIWYQCHHCAHTSGKFRIGFDCTARYDGASLNDKLMKGSNLSNTLIGVLSRFGHIKFALVSNIKKCSTNEMYC